VGNPCTELVTVENWPSIAGAAFLDTSELPKIAANFGKNFSGVAFTWV
jgi:hypothetical protein